MIRGVTILNNVFGLKLQASGFKLIGTTPRLAACSLRLVAPNSKLQSFQLTIKRN